MPALPRKHHHDAQQRLALQLLAGVPFGTTEAGMFFDGVKRQMLVRLVRTGLATKERENVKAGNRSAALGSLRPADQALEGY
jgi:hypothetical protein